jgi:amino acid transporter
MRSVSGAITSLFRAGGRAVLGREKRPTERGIFHTLSLVAFFAWVGLGADGLSSSCYGPEEAYLALRGHEHLAIFLALATAATVSIIAASYGQIIRLFPSGGGGYIVASRLLSPTAGVISGCALVVDYVLTIAISIASGVAALLSFSSHADSPLKVPLCLLAILLLLMMNLRGLKESVKILTPIFLLFVVTHAVLVVGSVVTHAGAIPAVVTDSVQGTRESIGSIGLLATMFIFLRAFSLGAGTYTGIEAVSNGLPVLREPRVRTGRRTMVYMAVSLALTAGGILVAYRLFDIHHRPGQTLNAALLHSFADPWNSGPIPFGTLFVFLALLAEGALLFVAAQTGFVDGPRVLASMAVDRWVPNRFANLSSRLVTGNGILLMGSLGALAVIYTRANVTHLMLMYSINVFVTFSLSQLGMVRHWWQVRSSERGWLAPLLLNGTGLLISAAILITTIVMKFFHGAWLTLVVTGSAVVLAMLIRRHYRRVGLALTVLNLTVEQSLGSSQRRHEPLRRPVAIFVNRYDGLGLHTLGRTVDIFGAEIGKIVFLSVIQVDSDQLRSEDHIATLESARRADLARYEERARALGFQAESRCTVGTDVVEELVSLSLDIAKGADPYPLFIAGQLVFDRETLAIRLLHNEVAFAVQRRLVFHGYDMVVLPVQVPEDL